MRWKNWCWSGWEKWERKNWPVLALLMSPVRLPPPVMRQDSKWGNLSYRLQEGKIRAPSFWSLASKRPVVSPWNVTCSIFLTRKNIRDPGSCQRVSYMVLAFQVHLGHYFRPSSLLWKKVAASIFKSISHCFFLKTVTGAVSFIPAAACWEVMFLDFHPLSSVMATDVLLMDVCSRLLADPSYAAQVQDWTELSALPSKTSREGL